MVVIIKSAPHTAEGAIGLALANEGGADLVLLQSGVYFAQKERLGSFTGSVYVLDDDKRLRGIRDSELDSRARIIDYDRLIDVMVGAEKVVGLF